jgi:hypothetical protein
MRPWLARVALLVTLILPQPTENAIAQGGAPPRSVEAYRVPGKSSSRVERGPISRREALRKLADQ